MEWPDLEWNGMEMEWNGMIRMEWTGMNGMEWNGPELESTEGMDRRTTGMDHLNQRNGNDKDHGTNNGPARNKPAL